MLTRVLLGLVVAFVVASGAVAEPSLTEGELDLLRSQLAQCWSPPSGWTDPAQVRVVLLLSLNADGSLDGSAARKSGCSLPANSLRPRSKASCREASSA